MAKLVQIYVEGVSQEQLDDAVDNLQDQIDALGGNSILAPNVVDGDTTHAPTGEAVFEAIKVVQNDVDTHEARVDNPHSVTKTQVGLSNVDNTSDANKPVSTAQQTALDNKVDKISGKGLSTEDYTTTEKNKLAGIESGATANDTDANLKNRANHTGTQAISTVDGLQGELDVKQTRENWLQLTQVNTFRAMFNY